MEALNQSKSNDEIDLFKIFQVLWDGKWKIFLITIFFLLMGFYYSFNQPDNYKVSFKISNAPDSNFFNYIKINDLISLSSSNIEENKSMLYNYSITSNGILDKFIVQLQNKHVIIESLSLQPYRDTISSNDVNTETKILDKSKEFIISKINDQNFNLSFSWPNFDQINGLSDRLVQEGLNLVKKEILQDLKRNKEFIETKNNRIKDEINLKIELLASQEEERKKNRLLYLEEQLTIAKKLNIKTINPVNHNFNISSATYFLIGYDAINQQMKMLKNRTEGDILSLSPEYLNLIGRLREVINDTAPKKIEKAINIFINESTEDWINYNLAFADISNDKKPLLLYVILSFLIGLTLGSIYVLIRSSMPINASTN
jgi:LPS O-antigen subunit length determinant protein (WzzB/FepE family)